jgi:hypothetical protein
MKQHPDIVNFLLKMKRYFLGKPPQAKHCRRSKFHPCGENST